MYVCMAFSSSQTVLSKFLSRMTHLLAWASFYGVNALFNLYSEIIMRSIQDMPGISVGGHNINNLRYADDTVLLAENEKHLQEMINIIAKESLNKGLSLNSRKTEVMVITRTNVLQNATSN